MDARHPNSNTDQSSESRPREPLATQLARGNKKYKSAIDLTYAYGKATLDNGTNKQTRFSSGDNIFAFIRGFYVLEGLPNFFIKQMFFEELIRQGSALVFIEDNILTSNSKPHLLQLINQLHQIANEGKLISAPE